MAAKKKPPKQRSGKFLSRSQIAAREKRAARWARVKEVLGVALVVLTVAAIISLISHHPSDRSFNAATSSSSYQNYLGWFGAYLSDLLIQLLGFGAFFFPIFTFILALGCFVRLTGSRISAAVRFGGASLFALSLLGLVSLLFTSDPLFENAPAGGVTGAFLSSFVGRFLGRAGAYLVFTFTLFSSILAMTGITVKTVAFSSWNFLVMIWGKIRQRRQLARGRAVRTRSRRQETAPAKAGASAEPEIIDHLPIPRPRKTKAAVKQESFDFRAGGRPFKLPSLSLLDDPPESRTILSREELIANSRILERKLKDFGVSGKVTQVHPGPVITMYEFEPAPGVKVNRIVNLADDLALAMSALAVRVVAPIPGKAVVGIEIPNHKRDIVHLKDVMLSDEYRSNSSKLTVALGKDIFGRPRAGDLGKMPHVLIAGATGAGKSVMINSMICSILFNAGPGDVQFLMIDPKMVELTNYDGIPHLIAPVVSNPKKAAYALRNAIGIMEERYRLLAEKKVRNIESYNKTLRKEAAAGAENPSPLMPYLVIVIDELADLMILAQSDVEDSITRLAQLSRAVGIHLMIATQRPSTNVITGIIKANLPVRISFQVASKIDSRVILDANGAEQLLGKGDMLYLPPGTNRLERVHGAYLTEDDVNRLVEYLKEQAAPTYDESILKAPPTEEPGQTEGEEDEMYDQAVEIVTRSGQASISFIQRKLRVGYNRAARMIEAMEKAGILSPADGARPRKILVRRDYNE
jgi:S-DNA-T family DNA segregation ATPase FtsK/SpoIIIE